MKYRVKEHKICTRSSNAVINLTRKGFRLRSVAYFVNGDGTRNYTLIKNSL